MKQNLLGGPLGRGAMFLRDKFGILKQAWVSPEQVGTLANDQLATYLITKICKPHCTFIDVGAHIGSVISEVKHNDASVKIVAIEAIPEKADNLRRKFPFVELHGCAVGEATGETSFFVNTKRSGYSSLGRAGSIDDKSTYEIKIRIETLDNLVSSMDVDAIKIDVEGAELGVLRGGVDTLRKCRPIIMFESGPQVDDGLGYTKEAIYDFLASNDFSVLVPNRVAHNGDALTLTGFIESHWFPRRTTNYFAIPTERRIECRDRARGILRINGA
jgi:FkbM family methyltransferase